LALAAVLIGETGSRIGSCESAGLIRDFPALQRRVNAVIGIALAPVGGSQTLLYLGHWRSGAAWSTIKVPLVMAALHTQDPPRVTEEMTAAITRSDNAAAEAIWASLGDPATAARKVEAVLSQAGDPTSVQSQRVRPQFTAFGQTDWSLTDQAHFLAVAACDVRNSPVLTLMGQVVADQQWGLGTIAGARFKGGWGPFPSGKYLDRQIGWISTPAGLSAVAVAAEPYSGSSDDGVRSLNDIAAWLSDHVAMLPSGQCHH
ncbi:MAG: hypothetical protein JWM76_918, partial [Pseudonocardiales bacterium]|nr:hypothetical protein [Pseudonocardiales bacterium]